MLLRQIFSNLVARLARTFNIVTGPQGNRLLRLAASSRRLPNRLDLAIERAIHCFESQPELEYDPMYILARLHESGLETRVHFVEQRLAEYGERFNVPFLRLFDQDYVTSFPVASALTVV